MAMGEHEGRLRAMLDPSWNLDDEDRAAIRWALRTIEGYEDERAAIGREYVRSLHDMIRLRDAVGSYVPAGTDEEG